MVILNYIKYIKFCSQKGFMLKTWPIKLAILTLILSILPLEYGFYYFGKLIVCCVAVYYCSQNYKKNLEKQNKFFWYFLGIAILYNPIIPIHLLFRPAWIVVDIILIIFLFKYLKLNK